MRNNQNITITGERVVLVPYKAEHVLKYHEWMKSSELQQLTASEPLSLEEEYDMQQKWAVDEDKCTFIVLDREVYEKTGDETAAMIGDTNLFFQSESGNNLTAEAEIMIAEKDYRRKRRGWEAVLLMLRYVHLWNKMIPQSTYESLPAFISSQSSPTSISSLQSSFADEVSEMFNVIWENAREYKRFNATGTNLLIKFKPLDEVDDLNTQLKLTVENLVKYVVKNIDPKNYVHKYSEDEKGPLNDSVNVAFATYVTTGARLKLYDHLES